MLFFFFSLYGVHRYLHVLTHSFPTRRSSDLSVSPDCPKWRKIRLPSPNTGPGAGALSACPPCSNRSGSSCRRVASPARSANPAGGRKERKCRRGPAPGLRPPPTPAPLLIERTSVVQGASV